MARDWRTWAEFYASGPFPSHGDEFDCSRCGRLFDGGDSFELRQQLELSAFGGEWLNRPLDLESEDPEWPKAPADVQRVMIWSYEEALAALERGVALGWLDQSGFLFAPPDDFAFICPDCWVARARAAAARKDRSKQIRSERQVPPALRFRVLQRDGFRCAYCGRSARDGATLEVDHVEPFSQGGATDESNLITACAECNSGKSSRPVV